MGHYDNSAVYHSRHGDGSLRQLGSVSQQTRRWVITTTRQCITADTAMGHYDNSSVYHSRHGDGSLRQLSRHEDETKDVAYINE